MVPKKDTYQMKIAGLWRRLPLLEVGPGLRIAVLNILGDTELVRACAARLAARLDRTAYDLIVTPEAKCIPLAYALSLSTGKGYIVLRKSYRPYMGDSLKAETRSSITGEPEALFLDEKDRRLVHGKRVILIDDVVSTGSTLERMAKLMDLAGAIVVAEAALLTEGESEKWSRIIALGHLPLFPEGDPKEPY